MSFGAAKKQQQCLSGNILSGDSSIWQQWVYEVFKKNSAEPHKTWSATCGLLVIFCAGLVIEIVS